MDVQQELYTTVLVGLRDALETEVYDGALPPEGTPYPFVYLGDTGDTDVGIHKNAPWSRATIRIHVWHDNPEKRGTLSEIMRQVKDYLRGLGGQWDLRSLTSNVLPDNTTKTPLLHGVIDATFMHY